MKSVKMKMTIKRKSVKKNEGEAEENGAKRKREMRNELGASAINPDERKGEVNTRERG